MSAVGEAKARRARRRAIAHTADREMVYRLMLVVEAA